METLCWVLKKAHGCLARALSLHNERADGYVLCMLAACGAAVALARMPAGSRLTLTEVSLALWCTRQTCLPVVALL